MWLCLYFPLLPLEIGAPHHNEATFPIVISDVSLSKQYVDSCNAIALKQGIQAGMNLQTAYAFSPNLQVYERKKCEEQAILIKIANWASQFSSMLSLTHKQCLLLEIEGSLRLFGSYDLLIAQLRQGLSQFSHHVYLAAAPTPLSARLLAKARREICITDKSHLQAVLADIPLAILELPEGQCKILSELGITSLEAYFQLPKAGLLRRFGAEWASYRDKILGREPDPQPVYTLPEQFHVEQFFTTEIIAQEALLFAARRLLKELRSYLLIRDVAVQDFQLLLVPISSQPNTTITVSLLKPSRDMHHFIMLFKEKIEGMGEISPISELHLYAKQFYPFKPITEDLFSHNKNAEGALIDRLQARLGYQAVRALNTCEEHRPEKTWQYGVPGDEQQELSLTHRPLWILPTPTPLKSLNNRPTWHGDVLVLHAGPERIQSGWWDQDEIARDYYVAKNSQGKRLWVFRDHLASKKWFLHGLFG